MNTAGKIVTILTTVALIIIGFSKATAYYGSKLTYGDSEFIEYAAQSDNIDDRIYAAVLLSNEHYEVNDLERSFSILLENFRQDPDHIVNKFVLAERCINKVNSFCSEFFSSKSVINDSNVIYKYLHATHLIEQGSYSQAIELTKGINDMANFNSHYNDLFILSHSVIERNKSFLYKLISKFGDDKYLKSFSPAFNSTSALNQISRNCFSNVSKSLPIQLENSPDWSISCFQLGKLIDSSHKSLNDKGLANALMANYYDKNDNFQEAEKLREFNKSIFTYNPDSLSSKFFNTQNRDILGMIKFMIIEQDDYFQDFANFGEEKAMQNYIARYED